MKTMYVQFFFLLSCLVVFVSGCRECKNHDWCSGGSGPDYEQSVAQGKREAENDLKNNNARIYTYGLRFVASDYDENTGLTRYDIAGCVVSDLDLGRADGYNKAIYEYIKNNGVPANSRKKWQKEILEPVKYFKRQKPSKVIDLKNNDKEQVYPGREISLRVVAKHVEEPGVKGIRFKREVRLRYATQYEHVISFPDSGVPLGDLALVWGPDEADLAFFRYHWAVQDAEFLAVAVLDLRKCVWLNLECIKSSWNSRGLRKDRHG